MRKILCFLGFILAMSSCTLETSDNGDLDGFWHLEGIDTIPTGGYRDMTNDGLFWAVEHKMLQLRGGNSTFSLRFSNMSDSLLLFDPYISYGHEESGSGGDVRLTDPQGLRQYGVQHLRQTFYKETLKSSMMVLRTDSFRLHFKKF